MQNEAERIPAPADSAPKTAQERIQMRWQANRVFSPGAPVEKYSLFAGRGTQVDRVVQAILSRGQHVILYGERGVGKTSLVKVLSELLANTKLKVLDSGSVNCDVDDDFASLWRKVFRELTFTLNRKRLGFNGEESSERIPLESFIPENPKPEDVRQVLSLFSEPTIIIIDEVDRLTSDSANEATAAARTLLADTIKTLSDHSVDTTLVLVGVADSVNQLIDEHRSIERSLVEVPMPRMSPSELHEIIDKGLAQLGLTITPQAKERIARLSQGLPHYTHLLGLHATEAAIDHDRRAVLDADVDAAIQRAVDKGQQHILAAYLKATSSPRKENLFSRVLLACALTRTDDLGYFAPGDVRTQLARVLGHRVEIATYTRHLSDLAESRRGSILEKTGEHRKYRFRFSDPLMQPFVIMRGYADGVIADEDLVKDGVGSTGGETPNVV